MSGLAVDSSVVAKWILPEPDSPHAQRLITEVALQGGRLIVLDLAFAEVANAIWKRHHRGLITLPEARRFLDEFLRCPVHIEPSASFLSAAFEIAARHKRSVCDALFVALSCELKLSALTADEPLYQAVRTEFPLIKRLRDW